MKTWTVGKRVVSLSGALLLLVLVVGGVCAEAFQRVGRLTDKRLLNDALPGIVTSSDFSSLIPRIHIDTLLMGQTQNEETQAQLSKEVDAAKIQVSKALQGYENSISAEVDRQQFAQLKKRYQAYLEARVNYLELVVGGKEPEAKHHLEAVLEPAYVELRDQCSSVLKWNADVAQQVSQGILDTTKRTLWMVLLIVGVTVVVGACLSFVIIRGLKKALDEINAILSRGAEQVASAASQVSGSSQSLAEGASEQAASLEETGSSLEEMASMAKRNADSGQQAKQLSSETRQAADVGAADVVEMKQAMDAIKASSDEVAKIIKTIDEIAFQTNILALNAAVEAARAGEAGAGFAVVADEVRNLAQRAANSARETQGKIEEAIARSENGVRISDKVSVSLNAIAERMRRVDSLVLEIATASDEQRQGVEQINKAVSEMDRVTQSNAGNAEEGAAAAQELNAQSQTLQEAVMKLSALLGSRVVASEEASGSNRSFDVPESGEKRRRAKAAESPVDV